MSKDTLFCWRLCLVRWPKGALPLHSNGLLHLANSKALDSFTKGDPHGHNPLGFQRRSKFFRHLLTLQILTFYHHCFCFLSLSEPNHFFINKSL